MPAAEFKGDLTRPVVANEATAQIWMEYVRRDVSDAGVPPAPVDVRANADAKHAMRSHGKPRRISSVDSVASLSFEMARDSEASHATPEVVYGAHSSRGSHITTRQWHDPSDEAR